MAAQGTNIVTDVSSAPDPGTTHFNDDTIGVESVPLTVAQVDSAIVSLTSTPGSKTIDEFLQKPSRIATGNLSASDTGKLFELDPFLTLYGTAQKSRKLSGVYLIRADVVITLQINAVRFQAGRYILAFMPSFGNGNTSWSNYKYKMHTANLTTISQLPHVEIDLAQQTHATLRIPFASAYTHLLPSSTASTSPINFGTLFMVPYWPLIPGSSDTIAPYTVWAHFENIHLGSVAAPQSGYSIGQKEAKAAGVGPVSAVAVKVAKTASVLGQIPMLAPATMMVSWLADMTKSVATIWGFSKPLVQTPASRVHRSILPYAAVTDQNINSHPLALVSKNEVVINSGASSKDVDEMSFDFVKGVFAYTGNMTWQTSATSDTLLGSYTHAPASYVTAFGKGYIYSPIAFLQSFFQFWRGGLKFRFKLVKTEFHSGRLRISYSPSYQSSASIGSISDLDILHQEIIDIRDVSEFEICIPYVSPELYSLDARAVGTLFVHVLDPLVAPSTVSATVPILVEVAGCPDLEFAVPVTTYLEPYAPVTAMSGYTLGGLTTLGAGSGNPDLPSTVAIGEKILSFRQLLRKFRPSSAVAEGDTTSSSVSIFPYATNLVTQTTSNVGPLVRGSNFSDDYGLIAQCYGLATGGVVLRVGPLTKDNMYAVARRLDNNLGYYRYSASRFSNDAIRTVISASVEGFVDLLVPTYNRLLARQVHLQAVSGPPPTPAIINPLSTGVNTENIKIQNFDSSVSTSEFSVVSRSMAEDGGFSFFLGIPPCVLTTAV